VNSGIRFNRECDQSVPEVIHEFEETMSEGNNEGNSNGGNNQGGNNNGQ